VLGHIPTGPGEVVELPQFTAEVVEVTGRAITRVRIRPKATAEADTD
jgi:putative hemolysin